MQISPRNGKPQAGGCVSFFLPSCHLQVDSILNKGSLTVRQDSLRRTIMYDYYNKSNRKQVKETVLTRVKIGFSLQQDLVFEALDTVLTFPGPALVSRTMDICGYPFL